MKQFCLKIKLVVLAIFTFLSASAYDFEANGLCFTITSLKNLTVSVEGSVNKNTDKVVIPQTIKYKGRTLIVTSVGSYAFEGYKNLRSVSFPKTVLDIGLCAFRGDRLLTNVVLPDSLIFISDDAFKETSIAKIAFPSSLSYIGGGAFENTKLCHLKLPRRIKYITSRCFANCYCLEDIQWPEALRSIGDNAFDGCKSLENFTIPDSVVEISPSIILLCQRISKLTIGKGLNGLPFWYSGTVTSVHSFGAFYGSYNEEEYLKRLKTVIIEDSDEEFSLKGFLYLWDAECKPAFENLSYFYVGRPLIETKEWRPTKRLDKPPYYSNVEKFYVDSRYNGHIGKLEIAGGCITNPDLCQTMDTLVLGSNIKSLDVEKLNYDKLKTIICKSKTPPSGLTNTSLPLKIYVGATLYVPRGCKEVYSNDPGWGSFWEIKEFDLPSTGITNVIVTPQDVTITTNKGSIIVNNASRKSLIQVFNLQGLLVATSRENKISGLAKGSYIVTVEGKTFKVVL